MRAETAVEGGAGGPQAPPAANGLREGCAADHRFPGQPSGYSALRRPGLLAGRQGGDRHRLHPGNGEADTILDPVDFWRDTVSDPGGGLEVKITGGAGYSADAIEVFEGINGTLLLAAVTS